MPHPSNEIARCIAGIPSDVVHGPPGDEAVRALVNCLGCVLAGSRDAYLGTLLQPAPPIVGQAQASVLGLGESVDLASAAELSAAGADALCYADADPVTLLSPAAAIAGAALALAEHLASPGSAFVRACLIGTEVACRAARALDAGPLDPQGADAIACNALGAAAACATLLGLGPDRVALALDAAAAATTGIRIGRAESAAGRAARVGLLAALDAGQACSPRAAPEGAHDDDAVRRRFPRSEAFREGWGSDWHATRLAYHPYACALHVHPVAEACIHLKRLHHLTGRQLVRVLVSLHPSALAQDSGATPDSVEGARRSAAHAAAAALLDGEAGPAQFDRPKLRNARLRELRARIELAADDALPATGARVTIVPPNGIPLVRLVRCAAGHPLRPLEDRELTDKFRALAGEQLATAQVERLLGLAWNVRALPDMGGLIRATVAEDVYEPAELPGSPLIPR